MNTKIPSLLCCCASALITYSLHAQVLLVDTSFTTDIGYGGAKASCITKPLGQVFGTDITDPAFGVADDFTVPPGKTWTIDTVTVYAYQTGSGRNSTISAAYLEIKRNSIGGQLLLANNQVNRMAATGWTGIYRVDTAGGKVNDTTRPVMYVKLRINPALQLTPGTYWMSWYASGTPAGSTVWCPPKVAPDRSNPPGQNALGYYYSIASDCMDSVAGGYQHLGFNFMLHGRADTFISNSVTGLQRSGDGLLVLPNPVHGRATVSFDLMRDEAVQLSLLTVDGRLVQALFKDRLSAGRNRIPFDPASLAAGSYYLVLDSPSGRRSQLVQVQP